MLSRLYCSLFFYLFSSIIIAAPVFLQQQSFEELKQSFHLSLPEISLNKNQSITNNLQFVQQHTDLNQITHIRLQQQYKGFLVYGGYAILHSRTSIKHLLTHSKEKIRMSGVIYDDLENKLGNPPTHFISNAKIALTQFKSQFNSKEISKEQAIPVVYIDSNQQAHWAYQLSIFLDDNVNIPQKQTAIVDPVTYKPFIQWDDIKTLNRPAYGGGFGGNERIGKYQYGTTYPALEIRRNDGLKKCYMENDYVKVIDMKYQRTASNIPATFNCRQQIPGTNQFWTGYMEDGYDEINGAYSPINDAMSMGTIIRNMYKNWYNVEPLSYNGVPTQFVLRVHYGQSYNNAFWDGQQMTFGDGGSMTHPLTSLSITAHEMSHGFTEQHSNLTGEGQAGAINEAFSDMATQAAEYFSTNTNTWKIGADILKKSSGLDALRYVDEPSRDGVSIDSVNQYVEGLDVHYSSGVYRRLFYLMATQPDWDPKKVFGIMIKANMDYWTPYSTFSEGACGILNAARDLGFSNSLNQIKDLLTQLMIDYQNCTV